LSRLVTKYEPFKSSRYSLKDLLKPKSTPLDLTLNKINGITFHNFNTVSNLYEATFGISFPDYTNLSNKIENRHDIIHRNGRSVGEKDPKKYSKKNITELVGETQSFVIAIINELTSDNAQI
jgi:hypothetical protein